VFNVLLQVLDDGRLTDGQGRTVDFRNTLLIMTSNVGSEVIAAMSFRPDDQELRERVLAEVRDRFRPEFLNRIDEIIIFNRLERPQIRRIVEIQLRALLQRLAARSMDLEVSDAAMDLLAEEGYDPVYGARPLKRVLQRRIQDPVAVGILEGRFREGDTIVVDVENGELVLRRRAGERAPQEEEVIDAEVVEA
jgi:ATP-dependent Clp protease ATP-binding subunit ClpB